MTNVPAIAGAAALPSYLQGFKGGANPLDAFKMSSGPSMHILQVGRDGELRIRLGGDLVDNIMSPNFDAHIVEIKTPRVLFVEGQNDPKCKSSDGISGSGDIGQGPGTRSCTSCPMAQWGSSPKGGNGQACKQTISVALMPSTLGLDENNGRIFGKASMAWWFKISEIKHSVIAAPDGTPAVVASMTDVFDNGKFKFKKVVLRITTSSFKKWDRLIDDFKALGSGWPLFAPVVSISTTAENMTSGDGKTNKVGFWNFSVKPCNESHIISVSEARRVWEEVQEGSGDDIGTAGHEAEGIVQ